MKLIYIATRIQVTVDVEQYLQANKLHINKRVSKTNNVVLSTAHDKYLVVCFFLLFGTEFKQL